MAILAGLAVPSYLTMIEKTKVKEAQSTLVIIFRAEGMYRLANNKYGTLGQLVSGGYIHPDPNPIVIPGAPLPNWTFSTSGESETAFTATATRSVNSGYPNATVQLDQGWTGEPIYEGNKKFKGSHSLHD